MKVMESSAGPGQRNKGTDARVGYLYKLPPSGDLSAMIDYKYNTMSLLREMIVCKYIPHLYRVSQRNDQEKKIMTKIECCGA